MPGEDPVAVVAPEPKPLKSALKLTNNGIVTPSPTEPGNSRKAKAVSFNERKNELFRPEIGSDDDDADDGIVIVNGDLSEKDGGDEDGVEKALKSGVESGRHMPPNTLPTPSSAVRPDLMLPSPITQTSAEQALTLSPPDGYKDLAEHVFDDDGTYFTFSRLS
jgi:hypothetical protein